MRAARRAAIALAFAVAASGCGRDRRPSSRITAADAGLEAGAVRVAPLPTTEMPPAPPKKGMIWIPPGALVAGTPPERTPRIADEEMRGEQVILHGFFIDEYAYPNEPGAIPKTGVARDEAAALCVSQGKRLCTELEWERACKGPDNTAYEYGDAYRATECGTGVAGRLSPSGIHVGCKSGFGVRDLHGGPWEWTASAWGRGASGRLVTVRGGNSEAGELVGRCANAMGRSPTVRKPNIGFRCCAGEPNEIEVTLVVHRERPLEARELDPKLGAALEKALPQEATRDLPAGAEMKLDRMWYWHPIGNEELVLAAGCAKGAEHANCGVLVARMRFDVPVVLAWASSAWWSPTLREDKETRDLWLIGGDAVGTFARRIAYVWGRIAVGEAQHKAKLPDGGS